MTTPLNMAFMKLARRAETSEPARLVESFVDAGPLFTLLSSTDHQIVYGRRGTGKTHALLYLSEQVRQRKDMPIYIDMRTVGSTGGLYSDPELPLPERGSRLLLDTLEAIHEVLTDQVLEAAENGGGNFGRAMDLLDRLAEEITSAQIVGSVERADRAAAEEGISEKDSTGVSLGPAPSIGVALSGGTEHRERAETETIRRGAVRHTVRAGAVSRLLGQLVEAIPSARLWLLLDEWSVLPLDLQSYLGDLVRRCFLPVRGITVKIGAIEYRSRFRIVEREGGAYTGIEIGADVSADVDLDDFMVFGNDADKAKDFFKLLIYRHISSHFAAEGVPNVTPRDPDQLIQQAFTQENAFVEFVQAAEGVPRDAINILSLAAQLADDRQLSMNDIRGGARRWYVRDKEAAVSASPRGKALLDWIIDEVIGSRRARAFLLEQVARGHGLVGSLYDSRVLHVIKKGVAARDLPGQRFDVYALDYGCYVELLTTGRAPQGLFEAELSEGNLTYIEVPVDDYRSIRRAILALAEFEKAVASS